MGGEVLAILDMNYIYILDDWVTHSVVCQLSVHFSKVGCGSVDESFIYLMEGWRFDHCHKYMCPSAGH